jgi:hypothetical protein
VGSQVFTEVASPTSIFVLVTGGQKQSPIQFLKDKVLIGDKFAYNPAHPPLFEENEQAEVALTMRNVSAKTVRAEVQWNVYPELQVVDSAVLLSTTTSVDIPAGGTEVARFPALPAKGSRYIAIAEVVENGQRLLFPMSFLRITSGPLPINMFGIDQLGGSGSAFDIRKGKTYKLFACPGSVQTLLPTTYHFEVFSDGGKSIYSQSVTKQAGESIAPIEVSLVSSTNAPDAKLVLTASSDNEQIKEQLTLSCGKSTEGDCVPLPTWSTMVAKNKSPFRIIALLVALGVVFIAWRIIRKERHHD